MSLSPTIITAANPEWFYNSKILTLHKDSIIALGWPFTCQRSINYFFLGHVLKYIFFFLKAISWEDVEFFMKTWKISTWEHCLFPSLFCPQKHPWTEQWCGAKYTMKTRISEVKWRGQFQVWEADLRGVKVKVTFSYSMKLKTTSHLNFTDYNKCKANLKRHFLKGLPKLNRGDWMPGLSMIRCNKAITHMYPK